MKDNLLKMLVIISLIVMVPRFFVHHDMRDFHAQITEDTLSFGANNLTHEKRYMEIISAAQCGVICDWSEPNGQTLPELLQHENCLINRLFLTDADSAGLAKWRKKFDSVHLITGTSFAEFKNSCTNVNLLIFDMQNVGVRIDRATKLLRSVMEVAAALDAKLLLLDVPNPLGGKVEGPGEVPLRPGVTLGELARYWNDKLFRGAISLTVVPVTGWRRDHLLRDLRRESRQVGKSAAITSFMAPFYHVKPFSMALCDNHNEVASSALLMPQANRLSERELAFLRDMLAINGIQTAPHCTKPIWSPDILSGLKIDDVQIHDDIDEFGTFLQAMRFFANRRDFVIGYEMDFDDVMGDPLVRETLMSSQNFELLQSELSRTQSAFVHDIGQYLLYDPAPYPGSSMRQNFGS